MWVKSYLWSPAVVLLGGVTLQDPRVLNLKMGKPKKITAMETMGTLLGLLECRAIGSLASCFASC